MSLHIFCFVGTHAEAMKKVRELRFKEYGFTTDTENDGESRAAAMVKYYKGANSKVTDVTDLLKKKHLPPNSETDKSGESSNETGKLFSTY